MVNLMVMSSLSHHVHNQITGTPFESSGAVIAQEYVQKQPLHTRRWAHLLPVDQLGIARRCETSVSNDCSVTVSQELQDVGKYPNDVEVEAEHSKHILVHTKLEALVAVTQNALRVKDQQECGHGEPEGSFVRVPQKPRLSEQIGSCSTPTCTMSARTANSTGYVL